MSQALLAMINARKAQVSGVRAIKPNPGRNRYRILPGWRVIAKAPVHLNAAVDPTTGFSEQDAWQTQFFKDFAQHFLRDAADKVVAVALCPEKTYGTPCQICDEVNRGVVAAKNAGDAAMLKRLEDSMSGAQVLMNVLALDSPTPNEVQVLGVAPSVLNGKKGVGGILNLFTDWPKLVSLGGPADGCADLIITKGGAGKEGTTYDTAAVPTTVTLTAAHLGQVKDLDQFVVNEDRAQSTQRALSTVSAVTGLLPSARGPSLLGAAAAAFAAPAAAVQHFDDVPDFAATAAVVASTVPGATQVSTPTPAVAAVQAAVAPVQTQTVAPSPVAAVAPDLSLEDLLKDL